jgi:hypothetical protein
MLRRRLERDAQPLVAFAYLLALLDKSRRFPRHAEALDVAVADACLLHPNLPGTEQDVVEVQGSADVLVTDRLRSYSAAKSEKCTTPSPGQATSRQHAWAAITSD